MSLMGMNRVFKKHGTIIAGIFAFLMLIVAVSGLGANLFHTGPEPGNAAAVSEKPVATVGDLKIEKAQLDQQLNSLMGRSGQALSSVPPAELDTYRVMVLNQAFKQQAALALAANAAGISLSADDLNRERDKVWASQRGEAITSLGLPAKATDADIDNALATQNPGMTIARIKQMNYTDEALRPSLDMEALQNQFKKQLNVTEDQVKRSYDDIQVRHILVKSGTGGLPDALAKEKAEKILAEVKADPSKMEALAAQDSDDPGSKKKGGFYDWAPASQYVPEFTAGAFAAGVGKVNPNLIKTTFGYHIIKLEGERPGKTFPKDWATNKQKYIDDYVAKQADSKVQAAVAAQLPNVKVDILDPGMRAAQDQQDADAATDSNAKNAKLNEALSELNKILRTDDPLGIAPLRRAQILTELKRPKDAIAAYLDALTYRNSIEARLSLADLYLQQNDKANALTQVEDAQKLSVPDVQTQFRIAGMLDKLGTKDLAKAAHAKEADMLKRQMQLEAEQRASMPQMPTMPMPPAKAATTKSSAAPVSTAPAPTASVSTMPAQPAAASAAPAAPTQTTASPISASPPAPTAATLPATRSK